MATRSSKTSSRSRAPTRTSNAALPDPRKPSRNSFPGAFVWGASTAAYQIEGAAGADGAGLSVWDTFCRQFGRIRDGDTGDVACDHYHRFAEDVALMERLGIGAYRFSIAWPRLLPSGKGAMNTAGIAFYDRLLDALLEAGIEPWLCLFHWELPQALQDIGGWANRDIAGWFADYATLAARRFGDRVKMMATFNEPAVFCLFGYGLGHHAPGLRDRTAYNKAIHHVNLAHGRAVDAWRTHAASVPIGCIHNQQPGRPKSDSPADRYAAARFDDFWNRSFPDPQHLGYYPRAVSEAVEPYVQAGDLSQICRPLDWIGVNHYSPTTLRADPFGPFGAAWGRASADLPRTGMGWVIDPTAFRDMLIEVQHRYAMPIYVLENGAGYEEMPDARGRVEDDGRIAYLDGYVRAMHEAIAAGGDIRGYFAWSLLDNFEWAEGYAKRFGLIHVDYTTQRRTPKASYDWYCALVAANALPIRER